MHHDRDQFCGSRRAGARRARPRARTPDESHDITDDWAAIVPAGVWHNVVNTGDRELRLYSLYAPPEHADVTVHRTKAEAQAAEEAHGH